MQKKWRKLLRQAAPYTKQNQRRRVWQKIVQFMACIVVFCTTYALILPAITMEKQCGLEEHTHTEVCYVQVTAKQVTELVCTYASLGVHVHTQDCYDAGDSLVCGYADYLVHSHDSACYDSEGVLLCQLPEVQLHEHVDACYQASDPEQALMCDKEVIKLHSHSDSCYESTTDETGAEQKTLVCGNLAVTEHVHTESCFMTSEVPVDTELLTCTETAEDHVHASMCYGTWELNCGLQAHTHTAECTPILGLSEEERAQVEYVIALIDEMPSADEINAKVAEFEEAGDSEGEEAYMMEVKQQVCEAYRMYRDLGEELQEYVTNADKLLELEYIWSEEPLAVTTDRPTIYQINSYVDSSSSKSVMVFGGTVAEKVTYKFLWWYAIKVEKDSAGYYKVVEILQPGQSSDKSNYRASDTGFILLFEHDDTIPDAVVGDYVTVHFTIPSSGVYKSEGYGEVSFSTYPSGIKSDAPTKIKSDSTSEFVELNLYDYNGNINTNYWSKNNWYPGFQWNGGAYSKTTYRTSNTSADLGVPDYITDRNYVDSIDFGNSLITNLTYGSGANGNYTKSVNATNVTKTSAYYSDAVGRLNWIYGNRTEGYTNKPIGTSTTDEDYADVMKDTLVSGYPALNDGTMLDYLFKPGDAVKKMNTENIDGLFRINPVSGLYSFNSRTNHAEYIAGENRFQLYDEIITPNFITYPFGNFLPLNTIDNPSKATQVSAFNYSGGMRNYVERIIADLKNDAEGLGSYWTATQRQLATMLEEYQENWTLYGRTMNGTWNNWENLSPANAIRDYFWGDTAGGGDKPSSDTDFITQDFLSRMYNIDWDVQTNFFFGMEMKMTVMMPKDGLTGNDNGDNSESWTTTDDGTFIRTGEPDGIPDYPMVFNFTGDDDVWVYVDEVLFLDLSGIHRHVGGTIDFQTGTVYYFALDTASGDTHQHDPGTSDYYKKFSFKEILEAAGKDTSVLNDKGTFKDYTTHTFHFYYMERGSGSSVCRINFNFPMLRKNSINVTKENVAVDASGNTTSATVLGNPDYYFNIVTKNNELFVGPDSVTDVDSYKVMNSDGSYVKDENGADKVFTTDQYGIFTIKAGQTAVFEGIEENEGTYFVQELIKAEDNAQYPKVYVNDVESRYNKLVDWQYRKYFSNVETTDADNPIFTGPHGHQWFGRSGYDTNSSSQASFYFEQQNHVDVSKLGSLSIKKNLSAEVTAPSPDTVYKMHVALDGEALPVGTVYTIGGASHEVTDAGVIEIKAGETAMISNIISGTRFEIWEDSGSATGYFVSYAAENADEVSEESGNSISGIIRVDTDVSVTVTNSENADNVEIPVTKILSNGAFDPDTEHTYSFTLIRTDENGNVLTGDDAYTQTVTVPVKGTAVGTGKFSLIYSSLDYSADTAFPVTYYYRITENGGVENTITDDAVYLATVTVNRNANGQISADLTSLTKDGTEENQSAAAFVNTLTSNLTLKKLVNGSQSAQEKETFDFTLKFTYNGASLVGTYSCIIDRDGSEQNSEIELGTDGTVTLTDIHHEDSVTICGLPTGTSWEITETDVVNYMVSWTVNGEAGTNSGNNTAKGEVTVGGASVIFTNTTTYALPETGSTGTSAIYVLGGMMVLAAAALVSRKRKHVAS